MNKIQLANTLLWTDTHGVLNCKIKPSSESNRLDSAIVNKLITAANTLSNGEKMPFIIDVRDVKGTFSTNAAKLIASSPVFKKIRICEAFIVNSFHAKLLISTYKRLYDPLTPFVIVEDVESALEFCIRTKLNHDSDV